MKECPMFGNICSDILCNELCVLETLERLVMEPEAPKLDNSEIGLVLSAGETTPLEWFHPTGEPINVAGSDGGPLPTETAKPSLHVPGHILNN